jgi:hypothetical protein
MNHDMPQPGDAVRLDTAWWGAAEGSIAIIDGSHYDPSTDTALLVFGASAFRGPAGGRYDNRQEIVCCSGGPCPRIALSALQPTGNTRPVNFWRWRDMPRAGGGENYTLDVPLWSLSSAPAW